MDLTNVLLIALGLSLDAVAVALASGCAARTPELRQALLLAFLFGLFQALMPLAGWLAGLGFRGIISRFDHWIAFALLGFIGVRMIRESRGRAECGVAGGRLGAAVMLGLALATSIDALAVGLSFSLLAAAIVVPALIIGLVTFCLSLAAYYLGRRFGGRLAGRAELLGGMILIAIGLRILLAHARGNGP